ncbi:MAG TPA: hypothetical protein VG269_01045 [Tepidisphaeraceae bacterium]|jgi:hypothetical protein|nr:hypothetical protein [Tepidisphaeraceae bacterium]
MKQESNEHRTESSPALKAFSSPEQTSGFANPWSNLDDKRPAYSTPAPPPVWTNYIDSRLKQFCTR